ncbi:MAG: hypothetical protein PHY02_02590 [Phycisphaerae bacterium]|nr:hypothetical protein [Phycisphaerae bacterium]
MKRWVFFITLLFPATIALANPSNPLVPFGGIKLAIFYTSCFGLEVLLVATILFFCHMAVLPVLIALFTGNVVMYFVIFQPILSATENVLVSEAAIVVVEGVFIKMLSSFDTFRLEDFKGLRWRTAFIVAAMGNLLSYYSGDIISG